MGGVGWDDLGFTDGTTRARHAACMTLPLTPSMWSSSRGFSSSGALLKGAGRCPCHVWSVRLISAEPAERPLAGGHSDRHGQRCMCLPGTCRQRIPGSRGRRLPSSLPEAGAGRGRHPSLRQGRRIDSMTMETLCNAIQASNLSQKAQDAVTVADKVQLGQK